MNSTLTYKSLRPLFIHAPSKTQRDTLKMLRKQYCFLHYWLNARKAYIALDNANQEQKKDSYDDLLRKKSLSLAQDAMKHYMGENYDWWDNKMSIADAARGFAENNKVGTSNPITPTLALHNANRPIHN